jgi:4-amino-4-deoxy-L-arabinose transferase-like glycosyltransferase
MQESVQISSSLRHFLLKPSIAHLLFALCCLAFVLAKLPYMELPYYWDEAWVYAPAIQEMAEVGPSLAPDVIPAELTRGHPLLFHFLGGIWALVFGVSKLSLHAYALSISLLLLLCLYRILSRRFNSATGLLTVVLLCVQPLFFTQAVLVLPEVLLSLFLLLSLDAYVQEKWWRYVLFASAALLTKETAAALFAAVSMHRIFIFLKERRNLKQLLIVLLKLNSPLLVLAVFLLWQKAVRGWMFFPYHLELMNLDPEVIAQQFLHYFNFIFVYQGRNIFIVVLFAAAVLAYRRHFSLLAHQKRLLAVCGIFTLIFLLLSVINFYSGRYVLVLVVLLCMTTASFMTQMGLNRLVLILSFIVLPFPSLFNLISHPGKDDSERGYADAVLVMQQACGWLTTAEHSTQTLYAPFLIKNALTDGRQGYVDEGKERANVTGDRTVAEYVALSSFETGQELELLLRDTANFEVLRTFEKNSAKLIIASRKKK